MNCTFVIAKRAAICTMAAILALALVVPAKAASLSEASIREAAIINDLSSIEDGYDAAASSEEYMLAIPGAQTELVEPDVPLGQKPSITIDDLSDIEDGYDAASADVVYIIELP